VVTPGHFDLAEAPREVVVQPHTMADDLRWVLPAADGDEDGVVHDDDVSRAFRAVLVGEVAR
jgi:hypothetical protein